MLRSRLLPRDEWPRLANTELAEAELLPAGSEIVVVEVDDEIVACWGVFRMVHVEGCWVAPAYRGNAGVWRRLLTGMHHTAQAMGAHTVLTASLAPEVSALLDKLGATELPGRHYVLPIRLRERKEPVTI